MKAARLEQQLAGLAPDDPGRSLVLSELAWEIALRDPVRARALTEEALASSEPRVRARALRNSGYLSMIDGVVADGIIQCDQALQLFVALDEPMGQVHVEDTLTHLHLQLGAIEVALGHALRARELADDLGDQKLMGWALHTLGDVHRNLADFEQATEWYQRSLPYFEQVGHTVGRARTLHQMAEVAVGQELLDTAREYLEEALSLWRETGVALGLAAAQVAMARLLLELGDAAGSLAQVRSAADLPVTQKHLIASLAVREDKAQVALGQPSEGMRAADAAIEAARAGGLLQVELEALGARADIAMTLEDYQTAAETFEQQVLLSRKIARGDAAARARNLRIGMEVAAARREAEVMERILLDVLPASIVRELRLRGRVDPTHCPSATVLFTDIVGFTRIAARLDAVQLVDELDRLFGAFDEVSARFGLEKLKTIGDAYMAVAGLPEPDPHHALRATLAALHLRELVGRHQGPGWSIRIGLHSGPLVAGIIGRAKLAYDVWGDTVNTAARTESGGAPGRVNVSAATHALIEPYFVCQARGAIAVKGKGTVDMFFVDRLRPDCSGDASGLEPSQRLTELLSARA